MSLVLNHGIELIRAIINSIKIKLSLSIDVPAASIASQLGGWAAPPGLGHLSGRRLGLATEERGHPTALGTQEMADLQGHVGDTK